MTGGTVFLNAQEPVVVGPESGFFSLSETPSSQMGWNLQCYVQGDVLFYDTRHCQIKLELLDPKGVGVVLL